jgi:CDP-glycerol glycerophosphotransferase (TagB/SpsB family)
MSYFADDESYDKLRDMFGPAAIDYQIRQAIDLCRKCLPENNHTVDELEHQFRLCVDRALRAFRERFINCPHCGHEHEYDYYPNCRRNFGGALYPETQTAQELADTDALIEKIHNAFADVRLDAGMPG